MFSGVFTIFLIIFYSNVSISRLDSIPIGVETIFLITYIIYFLYLYFKDVNNEYIYNNASFWLVIGVFIYLGFTFFFNILANNLDVTHFKNYYYYSFLGDILKNIFFAIAIVLFSRSNNNSRKIKSRNVPYLDMV